MKETTYLEWEKNRTMEYDYPPLLIPCVEDFFKSESTRPPGLDLYPDVFLTDLFFPLQRQAELATMMRIAREIAPKVVYEIGADKGGGLYHWVKCLPSVQRVIACEIRGLPYRHEFEKAFPHIDFLWIEGSSYSGATIVQVARWLGQDNIDCLFIDGDKSAFHVDFEAHLPLMNPHGIVFMHDIQDQSTGDSFRKVRGPYKYTEVIDLSDTDRALAREAEGIAAESPHEGWLRHWKGKSCGVGVIHLDRPAN